MANAKEELKSSDEESKTLLNILKITIAYGSGKAVHEKDLKYLREKDPKMFHLALKMRAMQLVIEEKKKKKPIVEDEKDKIDEHIDAVEFDHTKAVLHISDGKLSGIHTENEKRVL